ncbi:chaplin [Streptomyces sp. TP-A0874]|uniref:chaplin n=1 Tax=Streptomyces sp. TP-A0874 TaxID=549819 RepID=UPI000853B813|nr:chaplin [Streptomyces sp. TP-A0874]
MKRITRITALTAASFALTLGGAGVAAALDGHGHHRQGATAEGIAAHSPGFLSGNLIQVPVNVPINVCGNTVTVLGLLNGSAGTHCSNW